MEELLKLLGFTTPLIWAGAAYGLFHWLDEKASDEAKASLAGAMKLKTLGGNEISAALVELFDRLYTYPLLRWCALLRSAILTLFLTAVVSVRALLIYSQMRQQAR